MSNGGTVEELDAQVDALVGAIALHNAVIQDTEQRIVSGTDPNQPWADILAVHHEIVDEYIIEVRLLRAEIKLLPGPRGPVE